jgi:hypothetical protein
MSKTLRRHKNRKDGKLITRTTKQRLILLISFLIAIVLILIFKVGEIFWPVWMIEHRAPILGILLFFVIALMALSPIIIEVNSNPRTLSVPGKNPKQGWGP